MTVKSSSQDEGESSHYAGLPSNSEPKSEEMPMEENEMNEDGGSDAPENENIGSKEELGKDEANDQRFQVGQHLKLIRVRFPGNAKSFPFLFGKRKFEYGRKVVAMSDRGMAVGYINSFPYEVTFNKNMLPLRSIHKLATDHDLEKDKQNLQKEYQAKTLCKELIVKHELDMELTHVELTQFGKKAVFYFTSPARVDFRNLVKDLVNDLKMRIELRQIGFRDRTAALGGIGPCGLQLCCNSFLSKYGNVNLKMAKNQNLTLNPVRLNGVCGQLKCCIQYEDEVYKEKSSRLPPLGQFIMAVNGDKGKVDKHHILVEQFELITDEGKRRRYSINQYDQSLKLPPSWQFPGQFEHIVNETDACIGLIKKEPIAPIPLGLDSVQSPSPFAVSDPLSSSSFATSPTPSSAMVAEVETVKPDKREERKEVYRREDKGPTSSNHSRRDSRSKDRAPQRTHNIHADSRSPHSPRQQQGQESGQGTSTSQKKRGRTNKGRGRHFRSGQGLPKK